MEIRFKLNTTLLWVVFSVALGSSYSQHQAQLTDSKSHETAKPVFITEPDNGYLLAKSSSPLFCEAKFVSKLKFNCTGGLTPKEIISYKNDQNVTMLVADISYILMRASSLNEVSCVCLATGYTGFIQKSRNAVVMLAYLNQDVLISPSHDRRVPKNSMVALRCQPPKGVPRPAVSWKKDGAPVNTLRDRRVQVTSQANFSLVLIRKVQTSDAGQYLCVASNLVGTRKSDPIKLNVYVDGGWSAWHPFSNCSASKCGNGTRMLKRFCTNPTPENGGQFCTHGESFKEEPCQDICPDLEITCPNHTKVYVNRSDGPSKRVSWNNPQVVNRKNGTNFTVQVSPSWAEPPVELNATPAVYVITYVAMHQFGQTAKCSFNLTVSDGVASACVKEGCKTEPTGGVRVPPVDISRDGKLGAIMIGLIVAVIVILLLGAVALMSRFMRSKRSETVLEAGTSKSATLDSSSPLIIHLDSYSMAATCPGKLRAGSPILQEEFDFQPSLKEPPETKHIGQTEVVKHDEPEMVNDEKTGRERDYNRTNSSVSNKSTASEISRMMWNITNLPENADPKMVARGLVDHNGGKFTIGDTGVSLIVPPQAIPEGHTEGIFIAIMNQEKEHPQVTNKQALLSPVVKCGPSGLKFERPVILSIPHCALLEDGAWNLKVQYNESEPGMPTDWKQLIDINKQDGSEQCLAIVEPNMVHLLVDHFTNFAVTGESASSEEAKKTVRIVAYVTPPEADGDCIVRVYCVGDTEVHLESVHSQEIERLGGLLRDAPKPFHFRDGGGDLLVKLTNYHRGWTNTSGDQKKIRFQHVWEGIERMPSCAFVFTLADSRVPQFRATFEVKQDCQDGDETEVIVSTETKQRRPRLSEKSESSNKATEQSCTCAVDSGNLPKAASAHSLEDTTASLVSGALAAASPASSPIQLKHTSSGYFSFGFEPLPSTDSLTRKIRNELIIALDPAHPKADWRTLAEDLGYEMKHIRWLEDRKSVASPTDVLLTVLEGQKFPLHRLAEKLHEMGREDAASLIEAQLMLRETEV